MYLLRGKTGKKVFCIVLAFCMVFSFSTTTLAATDRVQFMNYDDTSRLVLFNLNVLNTYLYNEAKKAEPKIKAKLQEGCKYVDGFSVDGLSYDARTGDVTLNFYVHLKKSMQHVHDITTNARITAKCNLLVSGDLSQYGFQNIEITSLDVNNCPEIFDDYFKGLANKKIPDTIWSEDTVPGTVQPLTEPVFKDIINRYLKYTVDTRYTNVTKPLPYGFGTASVSLYGELQIKEFSLTHGYIVIQVPAKCVADLKYSEDLEYSGMASIKCNYYLDTTDNTIVIQIDPSLSLTSAKQGATEEEKANIIDMQRYLQDAWKAAIEEYGEYLKLLES